MKGMEEGSGTRSSLLWEVKRLLTECENLPQVLVMENVPQVHSLQNMDSFQKWLNFLESLGYTTYWRDMNAKDYGVAQSRDRTIVVSFLGGGTFRFPKPYPLTKTMKDYLEEEVEEKYYINNEKAKILIDKLILNGKILTDRQTDRQTVDLSVNNPRIIQTANCIKARVDCGISNQQADGNGILEYERVLQDKR